MDKPTPEELLREIAKITIQTDELSRDFTVSQAMDCNTALDNIIALIEDNYPELADGIAQ